MGECAEEGHPLEESDLVDRASRGDGHAYGLLVQRYQEIVFRTAYFILGDAAEAEDAAQEAFVKAYVALPRFVPGAPFRPWILRIAANEARNRRAAGGRRRRLALRAVPGGPTATAPSPELTVLVAEQRTALLAALSSLRDEERLTLAYRYFFDMSEAEMAEALACARGTVKSRLSRALVRLRDRLTGASGAAEAGAMRD